MAEQTRSHDAIRSWADARGGRPARVEGTDIQRIDFDDGGTDERLEAIDWADFFETFDDAGLSFLYEVEGQSRFNKFISANGGA